MLLFIAILLFILFHPLGDFNLSEVTPQGLHQFCLQMAPHSPWHAYYQSLVCGSNAPQTSSLTLLLTQSGLIHLLVVSGSHLVMVDDLLEIICKRVPFLRKFNFIILLIYAAMTLLQPPVMRSLFEKLCRYINQKYKWHWSPLFMCLLSGLLCLALQPRWLTSISLLLSWVCSFAVKFLRLRNQNPWQQIFTHQIFIYLFSCIFILPLNFPHPISIVCNLILGPLLSVVLLPASLVVFILPFLSFFTDFIWNSVEIILQKIFQQLGAVSNSSYPIPLSVLWSILFLSHVFYYFYYRQKQRALIK